MEDKFFLAAVRAIENDGGVEVAVEKDDLEWIRLSDAVEQNVNYLFDSGWLNRTRDNDERARARGATLLFIFAAERLSHERSDGEVDDHDCREALCHMGTHGVGTHGMKTTARRNVAAGERRRPVRGDYYQKAKYGEKLAQKLARELHILIRSGELLNEMLDIQGGPAVRKYLFSSGYKRKL
jgi:hypothetical protein